MTTTYHDDHLTGAPLTAVEMNGPLGQLDQALGTINTAQNAARTAAITAEQNTRAAADAQLQLEIDNTNTAQNAARNAAILAEQNTRATADAQLQVAITNTNIAQDANRNAAINTEATARINGDAALQSQISGISLGGGSSALYTTLDGAAAAGQKVIPLTSTAGATAGQVAILRKADGSVSEPVLIASVAAGVSVTAAANLANAYAVGAVFSVSPLEVATARSDWPTPFGGVLDDRLDGIEFGMAGAIQSTQQLMKKLYRGDAGTASLTDNDAAIVILGDSTSDSSQPASWTHQLTSMLAADHPAWSVVTIDVDHSNPTAGSALVYLPPATVQTGSGPNTLRIYNAAQGSQNTGYHLQRLEALVQTPNPDLVLIAHGINEGGLGDYIGRMSRLTEAIGLLCPHASIVLILQDPVTSSDANFQLMQTHQREHVQLAVAKGYGVIDIWQAFWDAAGHTYAGINALTVDGIHPTPAAYIDPYAKTVHRAFKYWPGAQVQHQSPSSLLDHVPNLLTNGDLSQFETLSPPLVDDFSRTTAGGFGTPPTGAAWALEAGSTAANFSTNGRGVVTIPAQPHTDTIYSPVALKNQSARCAFWLSTLGGVNTDLLLRYVDANNYYRCAVQTFSNGQVNVSIVKRKAGANTTIAAAAVGCFPGGWAAGRKLWVAAEVLDSAPQRIGLKVWVDGTPEPLLWQVTGIETEAALAGAAGFGFQFTSAAASLPVIYVDDLSLNDATLNLLGWARTHCTVTKDYTNFRGPRGWSSRLLADGTANDGYIQQALRAPALTRLLGRTVTLAARLRTASATALAFAGGQMVLATDAESRTAAGAQFYDGWWWNVLTYAVPSTATVLAVSFYCGLAAQPTGDVTLDRIILCDGNLPRDMD